MKQTSFEFGKSRFRYCHGGTLRNKRAGRGLRQLATKHPLHLTFKADRSRLRTGYRSPRSFTLIHRVIDTYATMFFIKIDQFTIQNDHIHLLIRTGRRSNFQHFFRVVAGQIAQRFEREGLLKAMTDTPGGPSTSDGPSSSGDPSTKPPAVRKPRKKGTALWPLRPYTRIVIGYKAYQTVRNYIQLNEKEATREIPYRKSRLKGLSSVEWELLWT